MKFFLRMLGIWMIGLTLILVVIDGTKLLGSGQFVFTSVAALGEIIDAAGFAALRDSVNSILAPVSATFVADAVFSWPTWAITGAIGLLLLIAGRQRTRERYFEPL